MQTIQACFPTIMSLLTLARGSNADSADVDIKWRQINDDKWRLMRFSEILWLFTSREPVKMAANINATEHNTLPVLCNVTSSTVILSQHQHYTYIATYIYILAEKPPFGGLHSYGTPSTVAL